MRFFTKVLIERDDVVWTALDAVSAKDVAEYMGVNQVKVSHWKRGRIMLTRDEYFRLCDKLGVEAKVTHD